MTRRSRRVNDLLRSEISDLLRRQAKDPRLEGLVSVTEVVTSSDLKYAKVFVSIMGPEEKKREVLLGLSAATGFFRRELRQRLDLRHVPLLSFHRDDSIEQGAHLLELIHQVVGQEADKDPS